MAAEHDTRILDCYEAGVSKLLVVRFFPEYETQVMAKLNLV